MKRFCSAQCLTSSHQSQQQEQQNLSNKQFYYQQEDLFKKKENKKESKNKSKLNYLINCDDQRGGGSNFLQMGGTRTKQRHKTIRTKQANKGGQQTSEKKSVKTNNKDSYLLSKQPQTNQDKNRNTSFLCPEDPMILARQRRPSVSNQGSVNVDQQGL